MELLTNELLSEVLGKEIFSVNEAVPVGTKLENHIYYRVFHNYGVVYQINKYEFMHLCKEYIRNTQYRDYSVSAEPYHLGNFNFMVHNMPDSNYFYGNTELEAIIKATKWVIENKDK